MPKYHVYKVDGKIVCSEDIPEYHFLSTEWLSNQHFPTLETLSLIWNTPLQDKTQEEVLPQKNETPNLQIIALDYLHFTYVLECMFERLCHNQSSMSPDITHSIKQFIAVVRFNGVNEHNQDRISALFIKMMKSIILNAKVPSEYQYTAQQLIGYMLFHNFTLNFNNQIFQVSDILNIELSPEEIQSLSGHNFKEWMEAQHYPDKGEIEQFVNTFTPIYTQQSQQPVHQQLFETGLIFDDVISFIEKRNRL